MNYSLEVSPKAQKDLDVLSEKQFDLIDVVINNLSSVPRPVGVKKLRGKEFWRIRVGNFRILYKINDVERKVKVERVLHRKEAYRRL